MSDSLSVRPSDLIPYVRRLVLLAEFGRRFGSPELFLDGFDQAYREVATMLPPALNERERVERVTRWFEYKLGLRPVDEVDPLVLEALS